MRISDWSSDVCSSDLPEKLSFWFGHQGYEFLDLGRVWQIALFGGLLFWLLLMLRCMLPALRSGEGDRNLLALLTVSPIAICLFHGTGLFYAARTHLPIIEYCRWGGGPLWVEGIFD